MTDKLMKMLLISICRRNVRATVSKTQKWTPVRPRPRGLRRVPGGESGPVVSWDMASPLRVLAHTGGISTQRPASPRGRWRCPLARPGRQPSCPCPGEPRRNTGIVCTMDCQRATKQAPTIRSQWKSREDSHRATLHVPPCPRCGGEARGGQAWRALGSRR